MFNELTNAIKAQLYEKAISPLSGAFILSWAVWNYRFILVLVSSLTYPEKISYIDNLPISQQTFLYGLFFPFLSASVLIVLYPYLAKFFYEVSRKWQKELKEVQQKIDDEMPMDQEEARKIRRESLLAEVKFDTELRNKNDEISSLKRQLAEEILNSQRKLHLMQGEQKNNSTEENEPSSQEFEMLKDVASTTGLLKNNLIMKYGGSNGENRIFAQYCIDELQRRGFASIHMDNNGEMITVTNVGRAYIVKNTF